MKNKIFLFFALIVLCNAVSFAQQITGYWYGVGAVKRPGTHNSYLSELVLNQKGNKVTGEYNYYFRSTIIKTKISGTFNSSTRELLLKPIALLNYKSQNENGADCMMEGSFTLRISRVETSLMGQFNPVYDYRFTCPAINLKFVRGSPEERISSENVTQEPEDTAVAIPRIVTEPEKKIIVPDPNREVVAKLNLRSFDESPVIDVDADTLKVTLYDNGEVDNDTISLFYNRKLIAGRKMLSDKPLNYALPLDTTINEISMYAENLGSIPPNTALCIVYAGEQRFELIMASNFTKNAAIRFRRRTKPTNEQ